MKDAIGGGVFGFLVGVVIAALAGFPGNGVVFAGLLCAAIGAWVAHAEGW